MPIKGFSSIGEQTKEKVCEIYGRKSKNDGTMMIDRLQPIPYICDESGKEFTVKWRSLKENITQPRYYKYAKRFVIGETEILEKYNNGATIDELAAEFKTNRAVVQGYLRRNGITEYERKVNRLNDEDREFIRVNYPKFGSQYCEDQLNTDNTTVNRNARKLELEVFIERTPEGFTKCYNCKEILPFENFAPKQRNCEKQGMCKKCKDFHCKKRNTKLRSSSEGIRYLTIHSLLDGARQRAKEKEFVFGLDYEWVDQNLKTHCPVLGIEFEFCKGRPLPSSPSLDRVNNEKGYSKSNVKIISWRANSLKNDASLLEINEIIKYIETNGYQN